VTVDAQFAAWMRQLEARHLADLTFSEVSRALRALSSVYVERRARLADGAALSGAGKRAAFALFYAPIHYLLISHIVDALPAAVHCGPTIVDLGCGTGASGAAWASACVSRPRLVGLDRHPWTLAEAAATYRAFGLTARMRQSDIAIAPLPKGPAAFVAAFTVNEIPDAARETLKARLLERVEQGDRVLIVEPLARSAARWWSEWQNGFERIGGRADEWRFRAELPSIVQKLDRAAGLDHRELTGRSLWASRV